ncbi:putative dimethylaniline monooxygenase [Ilyonectria robusta]|uniref:putative dimethylaniline monooxygenase n=1 Tax=Ilyonectria robusta TaxID=1079257 RepID=UPI001E8D9073|nr:putative dimethylaniline monooxygenase [Ilyonectria robusta]KAH8729899.1 putative dimethylaniline monooxygenase [Ilyonectria robusta]
MSDSYDLIVIGAGWYGLAAAKTYIELHPEEKILVIEAENSCGGTWSKDRLYPGLKSNNLWGSYEYADLPMSEDIYGVKPGEHIPGAILHRYLTDFAKKFGVFERTKFNTKVDGVKATDDGGWEIEVSAKAGGAQETFQTKKLIVATGLTSQPNMPSYPGQETFTSRLFHAKDFCTQSDTVNTCKKTVVVGGGKSAFDCAYAFASTGDTQVDLIIRPTGQGPVWLCPPYVTPWKKMMEELLNVRMLTWFSPCPWGGEDGFGTPRGLLHGTAVGRFLVENFWNVLSSSVIQDHGYDEHPELFKLKPWQNAFWTGSGIGIHNYPTNFFDLVKEGKIRVHIADIAKLDGTTVHLTNGEAIDTDAVICATGWKKESSIKFANFSSALEKSPEERESLIAQADKEVRDTFPGLKAQPILRYEPKKEEPLRNYRFIIPSEAVFKRNIAFAGMVSTTSTSMFATTQALWICAFFDGKLKRAPKSADEVTKEIMLHSQFGKWRYPCGYGANLPDFAFDSLPYVDLLLNDMGLRSHRKETAMLELTETYKPRDYKGLTQEWAELQSKDKYLN